MKSKVSITLSFLVILVVFTPFRPPLSESAGTAVAGTTTRVSIASDGTEGNSYCQPRHLSGYNGPQVETQ